MKNATRTIFTNASGKNTFHPSRISRSYFRRGMVHRTQTKTNSRKLTLIRNASAETAKPNAVGGSLYQGTSHPPRKSVVMSADMVAIDMYSAMKKSANFIDEYSVWYPATSSASASAKSNGRRFVSANAETLKTMKLSAMAGVKAFH